MASVNLACQITNDGAAIENRYRRHGSNGCGGGGPLAERRSRRDGVELQARENRSARAGGRERGGETRRARDAGGGARRLFPPAGRERRSVTPQAPAAGRRGARE